MGATSVTGVSGSGSVAGKQKGSEEMSLGVAKLIGPRVVVAGTVTLVGGAATVNFPPIIDVASNYIGMAMDTTAAAAVAVTSLPQDANSHIVGLVLAGTGTHVVNWMIVKVH